MSKGGIHTRALNSMICNQMDVMDVVFAFNIPQSRIPEQEGELKKSKVRNNYNTLL